MTSRVRVELPAPLCALAGVRREVTVEVQGPVTQRAILDAVEAAWPALRGTMRDQATKERRAFIRFFGCEEDLSHLGPDVEVPEAVARGMEAFLVIGAIAGGSCG